MRIDPEMSLAWAAGTSRAATAAADPPDEPPGDRSRSHGLWVGPYGVGLGGAHQGQLGRVGATDRITSPAARKPRSQWLSVARPLVEVA